MISSSPLVIKFCVLNYRALFVCTAAVADATINGMLRIDGDVDVGLEASLKANAEV